MTTVGFIGTGNMASAIVRGITGSGFVAASDVTLFDRTATKAADLAKEIGGANVAASLEAAARADVVVIAVKPNVVPEVLPQVAAAASDAGAVIVSIAAGLTLERLRHLAGIEVPLVRVMPNVNATVGAAMSAIAHNDLVTDAHKEAALRIFGAVGRVIELPEAQFSAFTAIAGSSPAFVFVFIDALARAAVEAGMPKALATEAAAQAVLGSATLLLESGKNPWELADVVSSPGGTTVAGLLAMEDQGFYSAVVAGVRATIAKDRALGA
ncbi:pyrroline-5-carboxylate reductase [Rarobacter incanus]|uniref:Pyrroline-5-carboxylate reductase n=1 Tax=Rarobacter incanus TaxID=153494 RepID=A0A542SL88_9MICO|nr:pyrroline-5-carboxylate reductase [Rarobacter incanus]TQK75399.1 pyrroline-5-carboxylate reductase [Rarobacter incanus]